MLDGWMDAHIRPSYIPGEDLGSPRDGTSMEEQGRDTYGEICSIAAAFVFFKCTTTTKRREHDMGCHDIGSIIERKLYCVDQLAKERKN